MCDATTIAAASLVSGVVSSVAQYKAGRDEADQNAKNVGLGLKQTYQDLGARELEEAQAATQEKQVIARQSAVARGAATAGAASAGVSGVSVDLLVGDLNREAANASDAVSQNLESTTAQLQRQKEGALVGAKSQLNAVPYPGVLPLTLNVGSQALEGYRDIRAIKDPTYRRT
jgi:hypothetical protein